MSPDSVNCEVLNHDASRSDDDTLTLNCDDSVGTGENVNATVFVVGSSLVLEGSMREMS